jgi:UDP-N-acetylglucosamine diphosphorylase/glucosamine-1-phosphate N-acetyltransferase
MSIILFDDPAVRENLLPFTFTRPVADLRIGILTIRQKWELALRQKSFSNTAGYLQKKFPAGDPAPALWINGSVCPNAILLSEINSLKQGQALYKGDTLLAFSAPGNFNPSSVQTTDWMPGTARIQCKSSFLQVKNLWDIFKLNDVALREDYTFLTAGRISEPVSASNTLLGKDVFIEKGARVECSVLNTETGPIYIGKDAEVMEGALIRGPFSLGEHAVLKLGAKIYGATTIGPYCKAGGEISNSVMFGYSNKGHDGFLGNSVLGEWCNLGADTNNSNLKNNYGEVKLYNYPSGKQIGTGLQFCGLMMGDHSKSGINTMFNTGTVVGVCANIFGGGFPPTFIPDFSWGGGDSFETYKPIKASEVAQRVFERRELEFGALEQSILDHVFEATRPLRETDNS